MDTFLAILDALQSLASGFITGVGVASTGIAQLTAVGDHISAIFDFIAAILDIGKVFSGFFPVG
jgi:hypothetical protein